MAKYLRMLAVIGFLAAAGYVLAFVRPRQQTTPPPGRVVIHYWEKWTGREAAQMQEIVDDFNRTVGAEKGIWVECMSMTAVDQKALVATAAGVPPDVAGVWDGQVVQYAEAGALEPLEDMARAHGITEGYYKKVYWDACNYQGHLYGLISTPAAMGLLYNKRIFQENADKLRAAGCDPGRAPATIDELARYAQALDVITTDSSGRKRVTRAGFLPMEPDWYIQFYPIWFGGKVWDAKTRRITLTDAGVVRAFEWIESYSKRLGRDAVAEFRSGFGNFNSAQNAFLTEEVAMEIQGPWMANYIENLKPSFNRWTMSKEEEAKLPWARRRENYVWGAAPFPSAVPGVTDAAYVAFDVLVIPKGSKHKKEAFDFIAFVNRQDEMEKLCSLHCKNSPLANVSKSFLENHPNPYIDVYERLASSPHAEPAPDCPIYPEIQAELRLAAMNVSLLQATPQQALEDAQARIDKVWATYEGRRKLREAQASAGSGK